MKGARISVQGPKICFSLAEVGVRDYSFPSLIFSTFLKQLHCLFTPFFKCREKSLQPPIAIVTIEISFLFCSQNLATLNVNLLN